MRKLKSSLASDRRRDERRTLRAALLEATGRKADVKERRASSDRRTGARVECRLNALAGREKLVISNLSPKGLLLKKGHLAAPGSLLAIALPDGLPPLVVRAIPSASG